MIYRRADSRNTAAINFFVKYTLSAGRTRCTDEKRAKALLLWNDADFQMNLDIISNTDDRAVEAVNELYAICESSDDLHDAVIGCFAKGGV